jgi:hypothetical protein
MALVVAVLVAGAAVAPAAHAERSPVGRYIGVMSEAHLRNLCQQLGGTFVKEVVSGRYACHLPSGAVIICIVGGCIYYPGTTSGGSAVPRPGAQLPSGPDRVAP